MGMEAEPDDGREWRRIVSFTGNPSTGHDPLQTFAMTVLAAHKQARLSGATVTISGLRVTAVDDADRPTDLTVQVAFHADHPATTTAAATTFERQTTERAERDGTSVRFAT